MNRNKKTYMLLAPVVILGLGGLFVAGGFFRAQEDPPAGMQQAFDGSRSEAKEFIGYYSSIRLTPEQKQQRDRSLGSLSAPCCDDFSMATCCCECNLSRSIWGLSNSLIAREGASDKEVREKVSQWLDAINPSGFSGSACRSGGCAHAFAAGGCGGMVADRLVFP